MPTKYTDRLVLRIEGFEDIIFSTSNGLKIATGYEKVVFLIPNQGYLYKKPFIEFHNKHLFHDNIAIPESQKWRRINNKSPYIEFRSKDFTNIKIMQWKSDQGDFKSGMYYISPFDLTSDVFSVLIKPLKKRQHSH